jgi:hypothetical protein
MLNELPGDPALHYLATAQTTSFGSYQIQPGMKSQTQTPETPGFALVVTLSLMILLTIIAVGLLTLSSVSLRSASQGNAADTARANARFALMMALGELQKNAGPDQRITAPANAVKSSSPAGITGVWKSWKPSSTGASDQDYTDAKTGDNFLGYLISNPNIQTKPDPQTVPAGGATDPKLVSTGSLGSNLTGREISAPLIKTRVGTGTSAKVQGAYSWVVLDEGVKGRLDLTPAATSSGIGETITQVGSPARNRFGKVSGMEFLNEDPAQLRVSLPKLVSLNEVKLKTTTPDIIAQYFHDFTVASSSVQADVANGGLKTDLSVLFDGTYPANNLPSDYANRYLYSDTTTPFQNASSDSKWPLYASYARLYRRTTSNDNPRDGLKAALPTTSGYLKTIASSGKSRYEPDMSRVKQPVLMPTVARVDTVFTMVTRLAHAPHNSPPTYPYMLHLMYLPVITLHNPYSVPLRFSNLQVEFSDIPIGFEFLVNNQPTTTSGLMPLNNLYLNTAGAKKTFNMTISNSLSGATEVVMGAGETKIFGTPFPKSWSWSNELSTNGQKMFDWQSNQTGAAYTMPGMITGPNDGVGFDIDWLAPTNRSPWLTARRNDGVVLLKPDDDIKVRYGPIIPTSANNTFSITVKLGGATAATTQVFYPSLAKLETLMEEGTSPRFPEARNFPETFPKTGSSPVSTVSLYETASTPVSSYAKARPFAIFSVGAKTTVESFTKSRPVADTGIAFQMATCDFTNSTSQGSSPLEFAFVPVKNGSAAMESGGPKSDQAFLFGGNGSINGTNAATIYEIPMAPLQSIAQLRHANGGSLGSVPYVTYTVGESRAHPAIPSDATVIKLDATRVALDHSWLANDRLWDQYWFSTLSTLQGLAYTGSAAVTQKQLADEFFAGTRELPNNRNIAYVPAGKATADAVTAALTAGGKQSAAYIMTEGGFNVNSTSVPAWVSVLSSLSESDIPLITGSTEKAPGAPFLRIRRPVGPANGSLDSKEKLWKSYRSLDPGQIQKLAEEIVAEIRTRGPFLSMAEFVNRRLGSPGELTNKGAIQAALDRSNVNAIMESNARPVAAADVSAYGWQNGAAVVGNTGAGAPGEVSQGDVLSAIGSVISVRSDTFRIRAYGDARDASGTIIARTYCEAIVQRIPEYVDTADLPEATATSPANIQFGRQFKIVAFRWLNPSEV